MKETKGFDKWIGILSISVIAIVAIVFVVIISDTHLAKGTYGMNGDPCWFCNSGETLSGQTCINYSENTLSGYSCTWEAVNLAYRCTRSAFAGVVSNGSCVNSTTTCPSNQVLYQGNCTTIGTSCGSNKEVKSNGTCDCKDGYVKNGLGGCNQITESTCYESDPPRISNGQWCTCSRMVDSFSGLMAWECKSCSQFSSSECPTALCSVQYVGSERQCTNKSAETVTCDASQRKYSSPDACRSAANAACGSGSYSGCTNNINNCYSYTCQSTSTCSATANRYSTTDACRNAASNACNGSFTGCTNKISGTSCYTYTCVNNPSAATTCSATANRYSTTSACQTAADAACNGSYTGCTNKISGTNCYTYTCVGNPSAEQKTCYCGYCNTTTNEWEVTNNGQKDEQTCNSGCRGGTPGWGFIPTTQQCGTNSQPSAVEAKGCYCNTCTNGEWKYSLLGAMTQNNCNKETCSGTKTWGYKNSGACGGGGGGTTPTSSSSATGACYLVNHKYTWSTNKPSGGILVADITSKNDCNGCEEGYAINNTTLECAKRTTSSSVEPTEPVNPQTGMSGIVIAWIIGIFAIGYSFWYFKRTSTN